MHLFSFSLLFPLPPSSLSPLHPSLPIIPRLRSSMLCCRLHRPLLAVRPCGSLLWQLASAADPRLSPLPSSHGGCATPLHPPLPGPSLKAKGTCMCTRVSFVLDGDVECAQNHSHHVCLCASVHVCTCACVHECTSACVQCACVHTCLLADILIFCCNQRHPGGAARASALSPSPPFILSSYQMP